MYKTVTNIYVHNINYYTCSIRSDSPTVTWPIKAVCARKSSLECAILDKAQGNTSTHTKRNVFYVVELSSYMPSLRIFSVVVGFCIDYSEVIWATSPCFTQVLQWSIMWMRKREDKGTAMQDNQVNICLFMSGNRGGASNIRLIRLIYMLNNTAFEIWQVPLAPAELSVCARHT